MFPPRPPQACRRVWLGTFNPRTSLLPDSRDPQKVKEFLQEKYEKKRWYERRWGHAAGGQHGGSTPQSIFCPPHGRYVAPEQVKPSQSSTAEPGSPQPLRGDTGTLPQVRPDRAWGCLGDGTQLTLWCPPSPAQLPSALPSRPERPAPTSWPTSGATPSPALPQFLPSLLSLVSSRGSGRAGRAMVREHGGLWGLVTPGVTPVPSPGPAPPCSAFPSFNAFGTSPGAPAFGAAVPPFHIPPSTTGTLRPSRALGKGLGCSCHPGGR